MPPWPYGDSCDLPMYLLEMEDQWQVTCHVLCDLQCFQPLDKIQASFVCVHVHAYVYVHMCVQMCVHVRGRDGGGHL